jgi:hypothetical protein
MNHLRSFLILIGSILILSGSSPGQQEKVDTVALAKIKEEGLKNSQVMDLLSTLCDVYGPRLAWSPEYRRGADWVSRKLKEWGIQNVRYDNWAPLGKGWTLKNFAAVVTAPVPFPVIAYPAAWSPGMNEKEADVVFLDVRKVEDLEKYRGKLKGKFVLLSEPVGVRAHFEPMAERLADSVLLRMANADLQAPRGRRGPRFPRMGGGNIDSMIAAAKQANPDLDTAAMRERFAEMQLGPRKLGFVQKEGALAAITAGRGDGGTMIVQGAAVPQATEARQGQPPEGGPGRRIGPYDPQAPEIIPQVVFAAEHYDRMVRMLQKGEKVRLELDLEVAVTKADSGFNVIAEIPGTDLKDEVVMIGAHFDTWHAGTGATDDGTGTGACLEAMRILQVLADHGLRPRRTIRLGLWGAEEEGLIGSREYVSETFARRVGEPAAGTFGGGGGGGEITKTPEYDRFSVYFNHDNGTGRIRGVYLQGNEAARPIFRTWFTAFGDPSAQTITIRNTGGTDHQSFDGVSLPGFQFIQDPVEYESRTHHTNMDLYERVQEGDMKQAATIMAFFAYQAAVRDGKFPRKAPMPAPSPR